MYLTIKQQVKHLTKEEYNILRELCRIAKNLTNQAIYNVRQYYFQEKQYLRYEANCYEMKNYENYKLMNANMAQQTLKNVDTMFKSFFALIKLAKQGKYDFRHIKLPDYLPKNDYANLIIVLFKIKDDNILTIPYSYAFRKKYETKIQIKIPKVLEDKKIKQIRIIPKFNARFFEIQYIYEIQEEEIKLNTNNALAIDLGVNNLCTCATNAGKSFIIDGRKLKSINQFYNKQKARLQSIKVKQNIKVQTKQQYLISRKKKNRINDYINKTCRYIINYCLSNNIGTLVVGYNQSFQNKTNLGKKNNQIFTQLPFGKIREKLEYLCKRYNINYILQEESYTSKASFFDNDDLPTYNMDNPQTYEFSGKRVKRGLYQTKDGYHFNADCNGALNILRKSKAVDLSILCRRGELDTPKRIRIS
ncbi:MAG: IS200/IS605 family element transposase accessory protein TnpB [Clostridiales bacterium]|nr:IS200/IS605 family element transposase accessory protein TnpB [Clostridiales bacterium]